MSGGKGWIPAPRDWRDLTIESNKVQTALKGDNAWSKTQIPQSVDLSGWCSPVEDQLNTNSCTAQAGVGLLEYFQRRILGRYVDASKLFLYKTTRNLMSIYDPNAPYIDAGAHISTTLKAMQKFGVCQERYWAFNISQINQEPPYFCYVNAEKFQVVYFRLDTTGNSSTTLNQVKQSLAGSRPVIFGFTVYSSIPARGSGKADIPFPSQYDSYQGGHAVMAVGYDDSKQIGNYKGALLIRNSWGNRWGINGYGWLPYAYIEAQIATEFYTLAHTEFENKWIV